jgi:CMP/dCMP kinase
MRLGETFFPAYEYLSIEDKINCCLDYLKKVPQKKILVDGLAGAGKGTLSARIIEDLQLQKINTGDIYRTITWYLLQKGITAQSVEQYDDDQLKEELSALNIDMRVTGTGIWVIDPRFDQMKNIQGELHSQQVVDNVSKIAARNPVRDIVDDYQKRVVRESRNVFSEGRDMWQVFDSVTDVILIYLFVSDEEAILREIQRQRALGNSISEDAARQRTVARNEVDFSRGGRGKLLRPEQVLAGAGSYHLVIDTTDLDAQGVYLQVLEGLCGWWKSS